MFRVSWLITRAVAASVGCPDNFHSLHVRGGICGRLLSTICGCSGDSLCDGGGDIEGCICRRVVAVGGAGRNIHVDVSVGTVQVLLMLKL